MLTTGVCKRAAAAAKQEQGEGARELRCSQDRLDKSPWQRCLRESLCGRWDGARTGPGGLGAGAAGCSNGMWREECFSAALANDWNLRCCLARISPEEAVLQPS